MGYFCVVQRASAYFQKPNKQKNSPQSPPNRFHPQLFPMASPPIQVVAVVQVDGRGQSRGRILTPLQDLLGPVHPQKPMHFAWNETKKTVGSQDFWTSTLHVFSTVGKLRTLFRQKKSNSVPLLPWGNPRPILAFRDHLPLRPGNGLSTPGLLWASAGHPTHSKAHRGFWPEPNTGLRKMWTHIQHRSLCIPVKPLFMTQLVMFKCRMTHDGEYRICALQSSNLMAQYDKLCSVYSIHTLPALVGNGYRQTRVCPSWHLAGCGWQISESAPSFCGQLY